MLPRSLLGASARMPFSALARRWLSMTPAERDQKTYELTMQGHNLLDGPEPGKALKFYSEAVSINTAEEGNETQYLVDQKEMASLLVNRGIANVRCELWSNARKDGLRALQLDYENIDAHLVAGWALMKQEQYDDAEYHLQKASSLPMSKSLLSECLLLSANHQIHTADDLNRKQIMKKVIRQMDRALKLTPENAWLFATRATARLHAATSVENEEAHMLRVMSDCDEALARQSDCLQALMTRAVACFALARYDEALANANEILSHDPQNYDALDFIRTVRTHRQKEQDKKEAAQRQLE
ncbi:MAG: hypothetical protein MHM6MM_006095 [Cercozoa sp. M6MM]